jgi:hypothetical protein
MSGFTTFLGKLGKALAEGFSIAAGVGPIIAPFLGSKAQAVEGTVQNDLTSIGSVVTMAEALDQTPGNGAAKLAAATPLVAQIIMTSQLVSGKKIANPALFTQGAGKITSGLADILNSLDASTVQTSGAPLSTPAPASVAAVKK